MKIYFGNNGLIRDIKHSPVNATSHKSETVDVYSDFDPTEYVVSVTLRRADGVTLGPYEMVPVVKPEDSTIDYYTYPLTSDDTAIMGALEITVRYTIYALDPDLGEMVPVKIKTGGMATVFIFEAVSGENNSILNIQIRLTNLESDVEEIKTQLNACDEVTLSETEPGPKPAGHLWFKIL